MNSEEDLTCKDELLKAKKRALNILTECDRTEKQLSDKLKKAGFSDEVTAETMDYVRSFGYLDDLRVSVNYIRYYRDRRSRTRLNYDLIKKGVDRETITRAFEEAGEWDERDQIRSLAGKKLSKIAADDPGRYRKTAAFLAGRGYRGDDISAVLGEFFAENFRHF